MNNRFPWFHYPNHHWQHNHAIVIGAGIAGCQIAWHLAKKDWKVTLIDREKTVAKQASGNPFSTKKTFEFRLA